MNGFDHFALQVLLTLSAFLGVEYQVPSSQSWKSEGWDFSGKYATFEASSGDAVTKCLENRRAFIEFPALIHGAHDIRVDGQLIRRYGDPTFERTSSFYTTPVLSCERIPAGARELSWTVYSYSRYFARVAEMPTIRPKLPIAPLFRETLVAVAAGALLLMAIFVFLISFGKESNQLTLSFCFSNLFLAGYFLFASSGFYGIDISMLRAHSFADLSVWMGILLFVNTLRCLNLVRDRVFALVVINLVPALIILLVGQNGDTLQFGTTLPIPFVLAVVALAFLNQVKKTLSTRKPNKTYLFGSVGLGIWQLAMMNEALIVTGIRDGYVFMSLGCVGGLFFIGLALHERIQQTYQERDFLRENLEKEVERKTQELKNTQAELVQSAKLASLGTLSAGIAHEINNSLNFVNGALKPLQRLLSKPEKPDPKKIDKLFETMNAGLSLTFEIIKSLRNYTGLNQAPFKELDVRELVESVLVILRNQTRDKYEVRNLVPEGLELYGNTVALNQVLMNLIVNACDAMTEGGRVEISAMQEDDEIVLYVKDEGPGIPEQVRDRIFDPFFTTKGVGKGTGLGLHIVKAEIDRHHGTISVETEVGKGTTFVIRLPRQPVRRAESRVAA